MITLAWITILSIIATIVIIAVITFLSFSEKNYIKSLNCLILSVMISSWLAIICGLLWLGGKFF